MKLVSILFIFVSVLSAESFSSSKKILSSDIYFDNQKTFYCDNPYRMQVIKGKSKDMIVPDDSKYTPRHKYTKKGKLNWRAKRIEWEHVMPAHNFGQHLDCWKNAKRGKGRSDCRKDPLFNIMEADMHNLVPAIGEVNGDRSNYKFSALAPNVGMYGQCRFSVDFKDRRAFVRDEIRGDIARIYFYMSEKYNIRLSKQERRMFEAWDKMDPISDWEREKNRRVFLYQRNSNKFIEKLEAE